MPVKRYPAGASPQVREHIDFMYETNGWRYHAVTTRQIKAVEQAVASGTAMESCAKWSDNQCVLSSLIS